MADDLWQGSAVELAEGNSPQDVFVPRGDGVGDPDVILDAMAVIEGHVGVLAKMLWARE